MNNILSTNHTSIYKLLFVLFLQGFVICHFKCNAQEYQIGRKPQWVKEKVNHEEYKPWEVLSSVFKLTTLFSKRYLPKKKKEILHPCKTLCQESKMVHTISKKALYFCVADEFKIDSLTNWSMEIFRMQEKSGIIYSSRDGYDAHYKLTVDLWIWQNE